jgi:hypothetical protein
VALALSLFELLRRRTTSRIGFVTATLVLGTLLFPYATSGLLYVSPIAVFGIMFGVQRARHRATRRPAEPMWRAW